MHHCMEGVQCLLSISAGLLLSVEQDSMLGCIRSAMNEQGADRGRCERNLSCCTGFCSACHACVAAEIYIMLAELRRLGMSTF